MSIFSLFNRIHRDWTQGKLAREKEALAKRFNDLYTYKHQYVLDSDCFEGTDIPKGFAWMCPTCNDIHFADRLDPSVGLIYPKCCGRYLKSTHRLNEGIKQ